MLRFVGIVLLSLVLSLAAVLGVAYSTSGGMSQGEVNARWLVILAKDAPAAQAASAVYGNNPPHWAKYLTVLWERADVLLWWWLPLLLIIVMYLFSAMGRRRRRGGLR